MRAIKPFTALGIVLVSAIMNVTSSYAVTNFTANVFGVITNPTTSCPAPPSTCEILLSGSNGEPVTYNGFTIAGIDSTHPAKIVASETDADSLRLENALITATAAGASPCSNTGDGLLNCPTINFSGQFSGPPDTSGGDVQFVRQIVGTLMRSSTGAATASAVRFEGSVEGFAVGSYGYKKITCTSPTPSCGTLDSPNNIPETTQTWLQGSNLPSLRTIGVQLWFYAKYANDKLTIVSAKVKNPGGAEKPEADCYVYPPSMGKKRQCECEQ